MQTTLNYSKILIAVDSSEYAIRAAKKGFELAKQLHAEPAIVCIVDLTKATGSADAGIMPEDALIILKKEAEQTLASMARQYKGKNLLRFMPEGHPAEDIVKTAEAWEADLIVMGTHSRTGLLHLLTGSVTEYVIRHSKIPVMVVPSI